MRIYTAITLDWNGNILHQESYEYKGPVAVCCGVPAEQKQLATEQTNYYQTLTNNANQEFGQASALAQEFANEFNPIFQAGPNQLGWSQAESNAINSQIVTSEGQATANALQASGLNTNALGGGNEVVPQGAVLQGRLATNVAGAEATATSQQNALIANYQQGNQNFTQAAQALGETPGFYSGATGAAGAATAGGSAAGQTESQIASEMEAPLSLLGSAMGAAGSVFEGKG